MRRSCRNCVYYDMCKERKMCGDYYPCNDDIEDATIDKWIEEGRYEFYTSWQVYISEYKD